MQASLSPDDVAVRGLTIYNTRIKAQVESQHQDEFLMLDIHSGDYEVDEDDIAAEERLFARRPEAVVYQLRVGSPSAYFMGRQCL